MLPVEQPFKTYTGKDGKPLDNGYVYFGQPNQNPETAPVTVYWDADGTIPAAQPLRTNNGYIVRAGTPANVFFDGSYSELVKDSHRRQVCYARNSDEFSIASTVSNFLRDIGGASGAEKIGFKQKGNGTVLRNLKDKAGDLITVKDYGGVGDGSTDDTAALLRAAADGVDIYLDKTYILKDALIELKNGQSWYGPGGVRQVKGNNNPAPADTTKYYGASNFPVFRLSSPGSSLVGISIYPLLGEGVQANAPFTKIQGCTIDGLGKTWYDGINVYASDVLIAENRILDCGHWYSDTTYNQRGEGIFLSGAPWSRARVIGNYVRGSGKNGILVIGFTHSTITGNIFHANRMSAVQVAFLNGLSENSHDLVVSSNVGYDNGADGIDLNNNSGLPRLHLDSTFTNNVLRGNGWLYPTAQEQVSRTGTRMETNDGGSATMISIVGVLYTNNYLADNRKCVAYIYDCSHITFSGNTCFKGSTAAEEDTDGVRIAISQDVIVKDNKVFVPASSLRLEGQCNNSEISDNTFITTSPGKDGIVTPNDTTGFIFERNSVKVHSGRLIVNCTFTFNNCSFNAESYGNLLMYPNNSIGQTYVGNTFKLGSGIILMDGFTSARLLDWTVVTTAADPNGAFRLNNMQGTWNLSRCKIDQSGVTAALRFSGAASSASVYIRDLTISGSAANNSIRVEPEAAANLKFFVDALDNARGFADFSTSVVKTATYT